VSSWTAASPCCLSEGRPWRLLTLGPVSPMRPRVPATCNAASSNVQMCAQSRRAGGAANRGGAGCYGLRQRGSSLILMVLQQGQRPRRPERWDAGELLEWKAGAIGRSLALADGRGTAGAEINHSLHRLQPSPGFGRNPGSVSAAASQTADWANWGCQALRCSSPHNVKMSFTLASPISFPRSQPCAG
jgi:hypothetical protein